MSFIEILKEECVNRNDSAFPTMTRLNNDDLVCGFSVGGGPEVTGGSDWARSHDEGNSWEHEGCILPSTTNPNTVNTMRLSRTADGRVIAYGQRNYLKDKNTKFGTVSNEAIFCISDQNCQNWSKVTVIPHGYDCPVEISNPMLVLEDGRWLAPVTLLTDSEHLGEKIIVKESRDEGKNWNNEYIIFADSAGKKGFFEKKIIEVEPGKLLAFAWTVNLGIYSDLNNHFSWSNDGGRSWSEAIQTNIQGQTLFPLHLSGCRFLLIYNYRQSPPGIRIATADITDSDCRIIDETYLWQPESENAVNGNSKEGIDSFDDFKFGLPSLIGLNDGNFLAVFWNKEDGLYGIKTVKFKLI